jgi:hypothetical protein
MSSGPTQHRLLCIALAVAAASLVGCSDESSEPPDLEVAKVQPLDLPPGDAYLSPDGGRIATYSGNELCVYSANGRKELCADRPIVLDPDSIAWSPDGSQLTYTEPYSPYGPYGRMMREPDVWSLDADTGEATDLTDDGVGPVDRGMFRDADAHFDALPEWVDDSTIRFVRKDWSVDNQAMLMEVSARGGEPEQVGTLESRYVPVSIASTPDGERVALTGEGETVLSDLDDDDMGGIDAESVAEGGIYVTAFSSDGDEVLAVPRGGAYNESHVRHHVPSVVSVDDGHLKELYEPIRWAAWQSDGGALVYASSAEPGAPQSSLRVVGDVDQIEDGAKLLSERSFQPPYDRATLLPPVWSERDTLLLTERTDEEADGLRHVLVHLS